MFHKGYTKDNLINIYKNSINEIKRENVTNNKLDLAYFNASIPCEFPIPFKKDKKQLTIYELIEHKKNLIDLIIISLFPLIHMYPSKKPFPFRHSYPKIVCCRRIGKDNIIDFKKYMWGNNYKTFQSIQYNLIKDDFGFFYMYSEEDWSGNKIIFPLYELSEDKLHMKKHLCIGDKNISYYVPATLDELVEVEFMGITDDFTIYNKLKASFTNCRPKDHTEISSENKIIYDIFKMTNIVTSFNFETTEIKDVINSGKYYKYYDFIKLIDDEITKLSLLQSHFIDEYISDTNVIKLIITYVV